MRGDQSLVRSPLTPPLSPAGRGSRAAIGVRTTNGVLSKEDGSWLQREASPEPCFRPSPPSAIVARFRVAGTPVQSARGQAIVRAHGSLNAACIGRRQGEKTFDGNHRKTRLHEGRDAGCARLHGGRLDGHADGKTGARAQCPVPSAQGGRGRYHRVDRRHARARARAQPASRISSTSRFRSRPRKRCCRRVSSTCAHRS